MGALTVTPEIQLLLSQLNEKTELWDADGNFIGTFTPRLQTTGEADEQDDNLFDLAEAERRLATEKPVHSTQEILQRLKSEGPSR